MKKQKKIIILIILIITFFSTSIALAESSETQSENSESKIQKVGYSEDFKRWLKLSDEERENTLMPRMYDIPFESKITKNSNLFFLTRMLGASNDSKYSLKDTIPDNLVIKNQMNTYSCWAFATLSSLETNMAMIDYKNGVSAPKVYDYSERHMEYATSKTFANNEENENGYNRKVGDGGNFYIGESYLTNGMGAIDEKEMPFENNENTIEISKIQNKDVTSQVFDTVTFANYNKANTTSEKEEIMNQIKQHIKNYGSVYAVIHGNSATGEGMNCYNSSTGAKYCNDTASHKADHAISIIGWDDNYSIDNFSGDLKPTANGAWIVRNSWGESSGDNGLIYVSYEDVNVSSGLNGIVKSSDKVDYDNIYEYDKYFPVNYVSITSPNVMLYNIFDKKTSGNEYLTEVALYAAESYTCKVYVNPKGTSAAKENLQLVKLKSGDTETISAGYHTLEFASPLEITGSQFAVVIEIDKSDASSVKLALESKLVLNNAEVELYNCVKTETGKCFYTTTNDLDNCEWKDLGKISEENSKIQNSDSTIKAFTTNELYDGTLKNIEVVTPPTKTSYYEGDNFDNTGMVIKANYRRRTDPSVILNASDYQISNGTNLKAGQSNVTITYNGVSVNQEITVKQNKVTDLKIINPPTTTEYKAGHNFDKSGMTIQASFENGTTKEISDYTIENGTNLKENQTEITITYKNKSIQQAITVTSNPLTEIKVETEPVKTKYVVGQDFDKTGMKVVAVYQDGFTNEISDYTIENGTNLTLDQNSVKIKYEGKTVEQPIVVKEEEKAENSDFDKATCSITELKVYSNGSDKEYAIISATIDGIKSNDKNDSTEYYYYLSQSPDEDNIENWVKITDASISNGKLNFKINTNDLKNIDDLSENQNLYLYIKEVATKGENQSTKITKAMQVQLSDNLKTYVNDVEKNDIFSSETSSTSGNTAKDTTTAQTTIPNAGVKTFFVIIVIIAIASVIMFIKYRNLNKYVK